MSPGVARGAHLAARHLGKAYCLQLAAGLQWPCPREHTLYLTVYVQWGHCEPRSLRGTAWKALSEMLPAQQSSKQPPHFSSCMHAACTPRHACHAYSI
jgi:hypothetical protein